MKAFISRSDCQMYASDGGSSVRRPMYYTGVGEAGDAAIREAQAILAVTEPGSQSPLASICSSTNRVTLAELATAFPHEFQHRAMRASLVSSLAAFVEGSAL